MSHGIVERMMSFLAVPQEAFVETNSY